MYLFIKRKENTRVFRHGMNPTPLPPSTVDEQAGYFTVLDPRIYN